MKLRGGMFALHGLAIWSVARVSAESSSDYEVIFCNNDVDVPQMGIRIGTDYFDQHFSARAAEFTKGDNGYEKSIATDDLLMTIADEQWIHLTYEMSSEGRSQGKIRFVNDGHTIKFTCRYSRTVQTEGEITMTAGDRESESMQHGNLKFNIQIDSVTDAWTKLSIHAEHQLPGIIHNVIGCKVDHGKNALYPMHSFDGGLCLDSRLEVAYENVAESAENVARVQWRTFRFSSLTYGGVEQSQSVTCILHLDAEIKNQETKDCTCYDPHECNPEKYKDGEDPYEKFDKSPKNFDERKKEWEETNWENINWEPDQMKLFGNDEDKHLHGEEENLEKDAEEEKYVAARKLDWDATEWDKVDATDLDKKFLESDKEEKFDDYKVEWDEYEAAWESTDFENHDDNIDIDEESEKEFLENQAFDIDVDWDVVDMDWENTDWDKLTEENDENGYDSYDTEKNEEEILDDDWANTDWDSLLDDVDADWEDGWDEDYDNSWYDTDWGTDDWDNTNLEDDWDNTDWDAFIESEDFGAKRRKRRKYEPNPDKDDRNNEEYENTAYQNNRNMPLNDGKTGADAAKTAADKYKECWEMHQNKVPACIKFKCKFSKDKKCHTRCKDIYFAAAKRTCRKTPTGTSRPGPSTKPGPRPGPGNDGSQPDQNSEKENYGQTDKDKQTGAKSKPQKNECVHELMKKVGQCIQKDCPKVGKNYDTACIQKCKGKFEEERKTKCLTDTNSGNEHHNKDDQKDEHKDEHNNEQPDKYKPDVEKPRPKPVTRPVPRPGNPLVDCYNKFKKMAAECMRNDCKRTKLASQEKNCMKECQEINKNAAQKHCTKDKLNPENKKPDGHEKPDEDKKPDGYQKPDGYEKPDGNKTPDEEKDDYKYDENKYTGEKTRPPMYKPPINKDKCLTKYKMQASKCMATKCRQKEQVKMDKSCMDNCKKESMLAAKENCQEKEDEKPYILPDIYPLPINPDMCWDHLKKIASKCIVNKCKVTKDNQRDKECVEKWKSYYMKIAETKCKKVVVRPSPKPPLITRPPVNQSQMCWDMHKKMAARCMAVKCKNSEDKQEQEDCKKECRDHYMLKAKEICDKQQQEPEKPDKQKICWDQHKKMADKCIQTRCYTSGYGIVVDHKKFSNIPIKVDEKCAQKCRAHFKELAEEKCGKPDEKPQEDPKMCVEKYKKMADKCVKDRCFRAGTHSHSTYQPRRHMEVNPDCENRCRAYYKAQEKKNCDQDDDDHHDDDDDDDEDCWEKYKKKTKHCIDEKCSDSRCPDDCEQECIDYYEDLAEKDCGGHDNNSHLRDCKEKLGKIAEECVKNECYSEGKVDPDCKKECHNHSEEVKEEHCGKIDHEEYVSMCVEKFEKFEDKCVSEKCSKDVSQDTSCKDQCHQFFDAETQKHCHKGGKHDMEKPDQGKPNMGGPNMGGPNMGGPNMGGPNMGGPNMGKPNTDGPKMEKPDMEYAKEDFDWSKLDLNKDEKKYY